MRESFGPSSHFKMNMSFLRQKVHLFLSAHNKKASEGAVKTPSAGASLLRGGSTLLLGSRTILALHLCELWKRILSTRYREIITHPSEEETVFPWQQRLARVQA